MTVQSYPVTAKSFGLYRLGAQQPEVSLVNTSATATVYVDKIPQTTTTQGFPLGPLAVMPWPAGTPCYLTTPDANGGTVDVWPGTQNYWDPTAVASRINIAGVPAIDKLAVLGTPLRGSVIAGAPSQVSVLALTDVSAYQSLKLVLYHTPVAAAAPQPVSHYTVWINWQSATDASGIQLHSEYLTYVDDNKSGNNPVMVAEIPVRAPAVSIQIVRSIAGFPTTTFLNGDTITAFAFGSYRQVDRLHTRGATGYWGAGTGTVARISETQAFVDAGRMVGVQLNPLLGAAGSNLDILPTQSGLHVVTFSVNGTLGGPAGIDLYLRGIRDQVEGTDRHFICGMRNWNPPQGQGTYSVQCELPLGPVQVRLVNRSANTGLLASNISVTATPVDN